MWIYLTYHVSCFSPQPPFSFLLLFLNSIPLLSKSSFTLTTVYRSPFCHPLPVSLFSFSNFFPLPPSQHRLLSRWEYFTRDSIKKKKNNPTNIVKELTLAAFSSSEHTRINESSKRAGAPAESNPHGNICFLCSLASKWIWGFMALSAAQILSQVSAFCIKLEVLHICVSMLIEFSFTASFYLSCYRPQLEH